MAATYRLKGIGWLGGCAAVTIGFYLVSLQVAAERKRIEQTEARIVAAQREIRALETEFDTRANAVQLERWNGETLALVSPGASQFVRTGAQLAALPFRPGDDTRIEHASLVVPAYTPPAAVAPAPVAPVVAGGAAAAISPPVTAPAAPPAAPARLAQAQVVSPAAAPAPVRVAVRKAQAVAMLEQSLLSDATLGDLVAGARSEAGRLR
jgi:hypothetical protein